MKDIVIIANFCRDFSVNDNGRFMYLCKELSKENKVEIVTSDFSHSKKQYKDKLNHNWPFKITFLHERGYKKNISIKRFFSHYGWGQEVKKYLENREIPDVVYCAIPSLTAPLKAGKYCDKNKVKFIIDVQDLWPEAFQMVLNIPVLNSLLFFPFKLMANGIYKRADDIIAVSNTYAKRAISVNKKCTNACVVYLGTNLKTFDSFSAKKTVIKENEIWLGYCGSLSASYDLKVVFDSLKILKNRNEEIPLLVIMGDGPYKLKFQQYANNLGVNTMFTGRLPYNEMCRILCQCDIVVNPISKGAAASIINKHADYAASGLPVINTQECEEYRNLVDAYQMGFNCINSDAEDVSQKLKILLDDKNLRLLMGDNARKCAEEKFDRETSYNEIINCINKN